MYNFCRLIGHRPSRRYITLWRDGWQTECSLCATRLARVCHGHWVPIGSLRVASDAAWQEQIDSR